MAFVFYLVGPPGSGKRTVGGHLARLTGAALLDNHIWNDPVFRAYGADGVSPLPAEVWALAAQVRELTLRAARLARPGLSHILTNYLTARDAGSDALEAVRGLAQERGATFVPVWLECPLDELQRRLPLPERRERLKMRDPGQLRALLDEHGTHPPPPGALRVDTSQLGPADAALLIASHAGALF